ncbi:hypothetical protein NMG60_11016143 [Bertholletia excelsa]
MDRSGDVRREGRDRFSPVKRQIVKKSVLHLVEGVDGEGGDGVISQKWKRERLRTLSFAGRVSSSKKDGEMGCAGSNGEGKLCANASKRFKLPRKFSENCSTVDHAAVPRKLRSAMKKRKNHGFNGVEFPGRESTKKHRQSLNQKGDLESPAGQTIVGSITKDEKEVVETLSALAVMFPLPNCAKDNVLDGESAKDSPLPDGESSKHEFEESGACEKEDSKSLCASTRAAAAADPSIFGGPAEESKQIKCSKPARPYFINGSQSPPGLCNDISQKYVQGMPVLPEDKPMDEKQSCNHVNYNIQSEKRLGTGYEQAKHEEASASVAKPEMAVEPAAAPSSQYKLRYINDNKTNGLTLWPGLSSSGSHGAGSLGPSLPLAAAEIPAWVGKAASSTQPILFDNGVLTKMDPRPAVARNNSWKRCLSHVHVSHLIKILQVAEKRDALIDQCAHTTLSEEPKQGLHLAASNLNGVRNGLDEVISAENIIYATLEKKPNEDNALEFHRRLLQDQQQACTTSAFLASENQSMGFMSLSAGRGGLEVTNADSKTQYRIPHLQSFTQNHAVMPLSSPQNRFSTPPSSHLPVAAAKQAFLQPSPYPSSTLLNPSRLGSSAVPKPQRQWIWAAQYKPVGLDPSHLPVLQNGKQDPSSAVQYAHFMPPPAHSSLEVLGPKCALFSQQQMIALTSSSKRQHHYLPSGYGVLCSDHV